MTADTAVNLMLEHEILPNKLIPVEACPYIAKALERMWQVGFEHRDIVGKEKPVSKYDKEGNLLCTYPSIAIAARRHNVNREVVSLAVSGKYKTAAGFVWQYAEVG